MTLSAIENVAPVDCVPSQGAAKIPRLETPAQVPLKVKRLSEHAVLPKRGSAGAAGYDLSRSGLYWFEKIVCCALWTVLYLLLLYFADAAVRRTRRYQLVGSSWLRQSYPSSAHQALTAV
jgi:hypothetical protein